MQPLRTPLSISFWVVFIAADLAFVLTLLLLVSHLFHLELITEPLRMFMRVPVYYFEFAAALVIDGIALATILGMIDLYAMHKAVIVVANFGIIAAGASSALEMSTLMHAGFTLYGLFVPSSIYLLILFMLTLVASALSLAERPD